MPIRFGGAGNEWASVADLPLLTGLVSRQGKPVSHRGRAVINKGEGSGERN